MDQKHATLGKMKGRREHDETPGEKPMLPDSMQVPGGDFLLWLCLEMQQVSVGAAVPVGWEVPHVPVSAMESSRQGTLLQSPGALR